MNLCMLKNLLNMIYLSKKGCYNHTNNNYDHNTKIINIDINNYGKDNLNMDNNKGKIEIEYYNQDELERIVDKLQNK